MRIKRVDLKKIFKQNGERVIMDLYRSTKKIVIYVRVEFISDPLKHLVTSTFILLPRVYFKNVLKRKIFSWLR